MLSTSPSTNVSRPRGRKPRERSERQTWLESILPGRMKGYDLIRRYHLLDPRLGDEEFHALVLEVLDKHEVMKRHTRKTFNRRTNGNNLKQSA